MGDGWDRATGADPAGRVIILATALLCLCPGLLLAQSRPLPAEIAREIRFTIREIRIEGSTLIDLAALRSEMKRFEGSGRNIDDLNAIRSAIAESYRRAGYELLTVTYEPSRSRGGVHYFAVHEVRIGKVAIAGNQALSQEEVRRELPSLTEGNTPRLGSLARELFLFNDNPARSASLEYKRGASGVTDVDVKVTEGEQRRFAATYNNMGTSPTGTSRLGLYAVNHNFLGRGHQVAASVTTSDRPSSVLVGGFSYVAPLPSMGDQVAFSASYSDVDSGRVAEVFNVSGKGSTWGAHYLRNLARTATTRHILDFGYDERRYRDTIDFFGNDLGVDVTARPVSLGYRYSDTSANQLFFFGATVQQNLSGGAHDNDATYNASRTGASSHWQSWQFDASWQREFASGWMPAIRAAWQYTSQPLISAEQFGLGGIRAVRGFRERDGAGDRGWRANLELYSPRIGQSQRFLAFVDAGHTTRLNAQPGELASAGVSSYGIGWRAQFQNSLLTTVDIAKVANGTFQQPSGDWMLHVSALWWF